MFRFSGPYGVGVPYGQVPVCCFSPILGTADSRGGKLETIVTSLKPSQVDLSMFELNAPMHHNLTKEVLMARVVVALVKHGHDHWDYPLNILEIFGDEAEGENAKLLDKGLDNLIRLGLLNEDEDMLFTPTAEFVKFWTQHVKA